MKWVALVSAFLCLAAPVAAQESKCIERNNQCTPVVGCILGEPNEFFLGEVKGVGRGVFGVISSQGATCLGTFRRTALGTAKVKTTCDDGRTGRATFSYYHKHTGTGRGRERMSDGKKIVFWAGDNLASYFLSQKEAKFDELIACALDALTQASPK